MKKLASALPLLAPTNIYDLLTGEEIALPVLQQKIKNLTNYCYEEAVSYYNNNEPHLLAVLEGRQKIVAPAEFARQNNIKIRKNLPPEVKAQSRVEKLVQHKIISETSSYILNPNPKKQKHNFNPTINLGAVDKQMASISLNNNELTLLWKCWDKEYLIVFTIPSYVMKRNIIKFSLPVVSVKGFLFIVYEKPAERLKGTHKAGVDLGRKIPYTMAVTNSNGKRVAHYVTSRNLTRANTKRELLLVQKKHLNTKITHYNNLGLPTEKLVKENDLIRNKIARMGLSVAAQMGAEITTKLVKHNLNTLHVEDLRWVQGSKYGSKWNHSKQQESITHSLKRAGINTKLVNPKNTSQECYKCGTKIVHNSKTRTVWCIDCKTKLDRDFNAAMNIANKTFYPASKSETGGNCSSIIEQVTESLIPEQLIKQEKQLN